MYFFRSELPSKSNQINYFTINKYNFSHVQKFLFKYRPKYTTKVICDKSFISHRNSVNIRVHFNNFKSLKFPQQN